MIAEGLGRLARFCFRRHRTVLFVSALLSAACAASIFTLSTDQNLARLLPGDLPSVRAFETIREHFDVETNLFVLLEGGATSALLEASDAYAARLRQSPLVASADNRLSADHRKYYFEILPRHLFLILPEEDLRPTLSFLGDPAALRVHMANNYRLLQSAAPGVKERIARDPLDLAGRTGAVRRLTESGGRIQVSEEGYYLSEDGTSVLLHLKGRQPAQDLGYARELVRAVRDAAPPGFSISLSGGYAVAVQDEAMIRRDMIISGFSSFALNLLLIGIVFRTAGTMLHIGVPLVSGILWMMGFVAAAYGKLNPMMAGSAAIVAGLGIDYSLYLMTRFRHELSLGASPEDAVAISAARVGGGLLGAAATSILVFFSFLSSDLRGLADFGVVTGVGLALCLLATLTVFPALLAIATPKPKPLLPILPTPRQRYGGILVGSVLFLSAAAVVAFGLPGSGFVFEPDWKNLRPKHDPALQTQERIGKLFWGSSESLSILLRDDPVTGFAKLEPVLADLRRRGLLASYRTVGSLLPPANRQIRNRETLRAFDVDGSLRNIRDAMDKAGFRPEAYEEYLRGLRNSLRQDRTIDEAFLRSEGLSSLLSPFLSGGMGMAQIFTAEGLWERGTRERVLGEIRTALDDTGVPSELTGFKIVSGELERRLEEDLQRLLWIAGGLIVAVVFLSFRHPGLTLLALTPLAAGLVLLIALMKLLGLHLNVMNLIALPMVIGLGVDYGIHQVHLYRDTPPDRFDALFPVCLQAVFLDALTTIFGFGSLAPIENRGVASMGTITAVGMTCCLLPALLTLPAALRLLNRRRQAR